MSYFEVVAILLLVTASAGFVNHRWLRMPSAIGLLVIALLLSLGITLAGHVAVASGLRAGIGQALTAADLPHLLFDSVLSFMLFAGALHVNLRQLRDHSATVLVLATVGVLLSTTLYGGAMWWLFRVSGAAVPLPWCLVLGAILAPTDPIAVTGLLREVGLPEGLLAVITGESLFNDGVAVVVFTVLLDVAIGGSNYPDWLAPVLVFLREAGGGAVLGLATGWIACAAMRAVDEYNLELTITLALVAVTYSVASQLGLSGPIAVVVSGVLIGNHATQYAMSETTRTNVILFWSLIDELLNALLFLLVGLETLTIDTSRLWPGMMAGGIMLAVLVRFISAGLPAAVLNLRRLHQWRGVAVLTWGGLRGGISVAMALSLPDGAWRTPLLQVCYAVVVFTIVVQGLTMPPLVRRLYGAAVRPPEQRGRRGAVQGGRKPGQQHGG
ncbi:MAG TPA: sodium:proton antiporter [Acetobacteraceae bacterium]|nr:sodium:proton antiporter [Acetobacteraceae bacterium]